MPRKLFYHFKPCFSKIFLIFPQVKTPFQVKLVTRSDCPPCDRGPRIAWANGFMLTGGSGLNGLRC